MSTWSLMGRPWAKLSELKAGDKVEVDSGFGECFVGGSVHELNSKLEIMGDCGSWHRLADQADDGKHCIGIYKV